MNKTLPVCGLLRGALCSAILLGVGGAASHAQSAPRIAVFDPETNISARFRMDTAEMSGAALTLEKAGFMVKRVTAAQIDSPADFGADKFDVLVLRGDAVPRENFPELKKFASEGGVLVALAAKNPFNQAVTQKANKQWAYSPETPQFAWQSDEISALFGFRYIYRPALIDSGTRHTATPLWKKYLPQAPDYVGMLPSTWVVPVDGGVFYPLMRSRRGDGRDVTPQVYIARKEGRTAVIASGDFWTKSGGAWKWSEQTATALVRIALDLRSGALQLTDADKVEIPADLPPAEPLTARTPTGEVNPDNAPVVTRWGKFDGSGLELGDQTPLPRVLRPGASVELPLKPGRGGAVWLRVRGAVAESGAVLKVAAGGETLWNESIAYLDVGKVGNFGDTDLGGVPLEFNRRIFAPPTTARSLTLSNPGTKPLYFDAAQTENAPAQSPEWVTGMGAAWNHITLNGPVNLPAARTREWSSMRGVLWAQDVKAPGEADRWARIDKRLGNYFDLGAPVDMLIEGTPEWAAISPERYKRADRKRTVPPDPQKYREIVEYILKNYASKVALYEIWNEVDSQHFWLGNADEYVRLWKTIAPLIREKDPTAKVMISGLTGFDPKFLDTIIAAGLTREADMVGFHPYAGNQAAWDKPFTAIQGQLYSLGQGIEIYNNEIGFPSSPTGDSFTAASFPYTPTTQGRMTDVALSRLLANGVAKFSIFLSGGADGGFSYIDGNGKPYPGYRVLQDYFPLSRNGGTRLDVSLSRPDGLPQTGVYLAGARHRDGSVTLVVNPAEVVAPDFAAPADAPSPVFSVPLLVRVPLDKPGAWKARFGGAPAPVNVYNKNGVVWAEIPINLEKRTTLTLSRTNAEK